MRHFGIALAALVGAGFLFVALYYANGEGNDLLATAAILSWIAAIALLAVYALTRFVVWAARR